MFCGSYGNRTRDNRSTICYVSHYTNEPCNPYRSRTGIITSKVWYPEPLDERVGFLGKAAPLHLTATACFPPFCTYNFIVLLPFFFLPGSVPNGAPKPQLKISLFLFCPGLKRKTRSFLISTGFFSFAKCSMHLRVDRFRPMSSIIFLKANGKRSGTHRAYDAC